MRIKNLIVVAVFICTAMQATAGVYLRYNYLGYNPSRKKRIIIMADEKIEGNQWVIKNAAGKEILDGKFSATMVKKGMHTPMPYNYMLDFTPIKELGTYTFETKGVAKANIHIKKDPYSWILEKPLRWMRVARCGSHDALDHGFCHGGDTACMVYHREGIQNNNWKPAKEEKKFDASGGWHDAGDYLKFNLTIAYAAYFISRSYEVNPAIFKKKHSKTDLVDVLDEAKWGLDWLAKSMPDTTEFILQVGDYEDHSVGNRLAQDDELDGKRMILSALSPTQMGYTVAALAVGSGIFKKIQGYEDVANKYEKVARLIYRRALSKDAVAPAWYQCNYHFYNDDTKYDNLELAAAEMFRLTGDTLFLNDAKKFSDKARAAGWRAWESVNMPAHMCLMDAYSVVKTDLKKDLDGFRTNSRKPGNIWGLPLKYVWGGLYSYIAIGACAIEYQLRTKERRYQTLATNMIDYMLGCNNWGLCFVAAEELENTIKNPFSQTYTLQADKFPIGAISEGPGDKRSHNENARWFGFDRSAQPAYKFNTSRGVFYDHKKDFMCMETTIAGVADGIYMLALASKMFQD